MTIQVALTNQREQDEFDQHESLTSDESKKLGYPSQENDSLPDPLSGNNLISHYNRQHPSSTNNDVHSPVNTHQPSVNSLVDNNLEETDIIHLGRKPQDECSLFIETGKRKFKALWDSGAGQCVLSFDCYNAIPARYKSDLFPSLIRIRAANGTIIDNKGECDITFRIGQTKFTFPFLCSNSLSQQFILGHNFSKSISHWDHLES